MFLISVGMSPSLGGRIGCWRRRQAAELEHTVNGYNVGGISQDDEKVVVVEWDGRMDRWMDRWMLRGVVWCCVGGVVVGRSRYVVQQ